MSASNEGSTAAKSRTVVEARSDRELVVTRTFDAPVHIVFKAWSTPDLFASWWVPKSVGMSLESCEMDIRTGGTYRLVFRHPDFEQPMAFFGTYKEVTPNKRIAWSNEESPDGALTTVTFEEHGGKTQITLHELYPTTAARDEAIAGSAEGLPEQFEQLDTLLETLD
ncbi:SRPBCC family protein [Luteibacter aegosomaticola]|uniref:SRPBCC family protein n=1 Tax=Luteibacter aegosomaticola TaxID=2911538 RepID=UPI001FFC220B|nr:SRPBCC family protein [Luteibacter aegosomaticola]UPG90532.1 SRPBCC family protein [Luteibacter aegosomaticola]